MITLGNLNYDPATGVFTMKAASGRRAAGDIAGYVKKDGYRLVWHEGRYQYAHRLAWTAVHGTAPAHEIDHINGVRDDNRISNLREATRSQNMMNIAHSGVHWHRARGKWQALIRVNGKRRFLGSFATEQDARAAYERARAELHGLFSFIERPTAPKQEALGL